MLPQMALFHLFYGETIPWYICHNFFTHSSVSRHFGYFHVLAIANSAAVNTGGACVFSNEFCPDICPGVELQDHMVILFLVF